LDRLRGRTDGLGPRRRDQLVVLAQERFGQPLVRLDGFEVEAPLVTQPAPVDGVDVDALVAQHVIAARLDRDATADRARRARGLDLLEIPRARLEAERLGRERT